MQIDSVSHGPLRVSLRDGDGDKSPTHLLRSIIPPMGRWTLRHTDEVLVTKIESIISGAIRRSREEADEKAKPLMSYESFVEGLDEDDTFTTTLFEILLKELADRRTRPNLEDRRLIAHWTSENLHSLAVTIETNNVMPYNRFRNRSRPNLHAGAASLYTPNDSLDEEEDDFGMADGNGIMEGARIDSSLYDVYSGGQAGNPRGYPPAPSLSTMPRADDTSSAYRPYENASIPGRQLPVPHNHFGGPPRRWNPVSSFVSSSDMNSPALINRQPSIRSRPSHGRFRLQPTMSASEFSEFAARRRSSQRRLFTNRERTNADGSQIPGDSEPRSGESQPPPPTVFYDLPRATLFDPPSPTTRENGARISSPSSAEGDGTETGRRSRASRPRDRALLQVLRDGGNGTPTASGDVVADWRTLPPVPAAPRIPFLRRGGVQPPETMLPSADSILSSDQDLFPRDSGLSSLLRPEGEYGSESSLEHRDRASSVVQDQSVSSIPTSGGSGLQETPTSLPTPRSVSPYEENAPAPSTTR